jgi:hypothetical protein
MSSHRAEPRELLTAVTRDCGRDGVLQDNLQTSAVMHVGFGGSRFPCVVGMLKFHRPTICAA